METLVSVEGLALTFRRDGHETRVLERLDLTLSRGELVAIVGPSGVGKSTILRVLIGLLKASEGTVRIAPDQPRRRTGALVFQDARLLPWRRVIDNVAFGLEKLGVSKDERKRRAEAALAIVGLADLARRWPFQLSGGQRQRVALARALAVEPELLLMDEPFSALDAITREALQDQLLRVREKTGCAVLLVTHDIEEAAYLADRILVLAGAPGRIVATFTREEAEPRERTGAAVQATARAIRARLGAEA
jgi:NitT/TauT family transport system ATP-binding protein